MRPVLHALLVLALLAVPAGAQDAVLRGDGLGPVRIGMTPGRAGKHLKTRLVPAQEGQERRRCWYAVRADRAEPGIAYMVENGRITRIDVNVPPGGAVPAVATDKGIRIGSTEAEITKAYGGLERWRPHPIAPQARVVVLPEQGRGAIRLQVTDGKVDALWAGRPRAVAYSEGCS